MADNVSRGDTTNDDVEVAAAESSWSGQTTQVQLIALADITGTEGARTATLLPTDATSGIKVDLGTDNDVTLATLPDTAGGDLAAITTAVQLIDNAVSGAGFNITQLNGAAVPIGAGLEATAVRVTLATDSTGVVSVDDNGSSLTVDNAALSVTGGGVEASALRVTLASDSTGVLSVDDNGGSLTVDNAGLTELAAAINSSMVDVNIAANALNSSTFIDDGDWTALTSYHTLMGGIYQSTPGTVTDGDTGPFRMTTNGELHVSIENDSVGIGGGTQYTEDAAAAANPVGNALILVREDARAGSLTTTDGDNVAARGNNKGELYVIDTDAVALLGTIDTDTSALAGCVGGTELQVDIVSGNVTNAGTFAVQVDGNALTALQLIDNPIVAHDSAASGSTGVSMVGGYATNSIEGITQVANADASHIVTDLNGVVVTRPYTTQEEIISERISDAAGTSTAFTNFAAGGAGIHNYVTTAIVYNSSATDGYVDLRDGTAGSVIATLPAPATGGSVIQFPVPLKGAANTALAYDVSGALSTVYLTVIGYQAQG